MSDAAPEDDPKLVITTTPCPFGNQVPSLDMVQKGQRDFTAGLARLVGRVHTPCVIGVDAPWGFGKTTAAGLLHGVLKEKKVPTAYASVWESDHHEDPLIAIVSHIEDALEQLSTDPMKPKARARLEKAKRVASAVAKRSVPVALRLFPGGIVDANEFGAAVADGAGDVAESLGRDLVAEYEGRRKQVGDLKDALRGAAEEADGDRVVLILDELDRCQPDFAVGLLERLKHLLSVPGYVFVLPIDGGQLRQSVRHLYGAGTDADGYLDRFFNFRLRLPQPNRREALERMAESCGILGYLKGRDAKFRSADRSQLLEVLAALADGFEMSLRDLERLCERLALTLLLHPSGEVLFPVGLAVLLAVRQKAPREYERLITGGPAADGLWEKLRADGEVQVVDREVFAWLRLLDATQQQWVMKRPEDPKVSKGDVERRASAYIQETPFTRFSLADRMNAANCGPG